MAFMEHPLFKVKPPYHVNEGTSFSESQQGFFKSSSLPSLDRPASPIASRSNSLETLRPGSRGLRPGSRGLPPGSRGITPGSRGGSRGLPPGAVQFQASRDKASGVSMLPSVPERPGTGILKETCRNWLESSMATRTGTGSPAGRGGLEDATKSNGFMSMKDMTRTAFRPTRVTFDSQLMSVSSGLEKWPAKAAARARMGSLNHFTATPPRPISRERPLPRGLPHIGQHGGQIFYLEDWHYKKYAALDKRVRHDRAAGDMGR